MYEAKIRFPRPEVLYGIIHRKSGFLRWGVGRSWDFYPSVHRRRPKLWIARKKSHARNAIRAHVKPEFRDDYGIVKFVLNFYQEENGS